MSYIRVKHLESGNIQFFKATNDTIPLAQEAMGLVTWNYVPKAKVKRAIKNVRQLMNNRMLLIQKGLMTAKGTNAPIFHSSKGRDYAGINARQKLLPDTPETKDLPIEEKPKFVYYSLLKLN
jgi:hypothetical protein